MTKHLFISGMACACLLVGLLGMGGCATPPVPPATNVQNHGDVPPPPGSTAASPVDPSGPVQ